jgi:hypothetical protein
LKFPGYYPRYILPSLTIGGARLFPRSTHLTGESIGMSFRDRFRASSFTAALLLAAFVACEGDARTESLHAGMDRDSVLTVLRSPASSEKRIDTAGTTPDSLKYVWRKTQYFVNGHLIEILWYSAGGEKPSARDTVPKGKVTPVVLVDTKLLGVGRSAYERVVSQFGLPKNKY